MKRTALLLIAVILGLAPAQAEVELFPLFCDNAVLQREVRMPVYGTADTGEEVTVTLAGKTQTTVAQDGAWNVIFEPMPAGGPHTLTVNGQNTRTAENILIGDVWLCTGQSNMAGLLGSYVNKAPDILKGHPGDYRNDNIRLMKFATTAMDTPQDKPPMAEGFEIWRICEPDAALQFSATGYFFGINLQNHIDVPIGLIQTCVGGTPAESWTPKDVLEADPEYGDILDAWQKAVDAYPKKIKQYQDKLAAWKAENLKSGQKLSDLSLQTRRRRGMPQPPKEPNRTKRPAALYNGMIAPIHGYPIKGAVWYQGEANAHSYDRAIEYRSLLPDMIQSWRERWGVGDFPFFWVQLAPFRKVSDTPQDTAWSWIRETMDKLQQTVPNGGMACIIDAGAQDDIHPPYKEIAGARLALQARKVAYGRDVIASGPVFKAMSKRDGEAVLTLDNVGDGLEQRELHLDLGQVMVSGDALSGFTICGEDKQFVPAQAKITGKNTVEVWSERVNKPVAVRYAWADFPLANLYNSAGLPAGPFRTDDFPPPAEQK